MTHNGQHLPKRQRKQEHSINWLHFIWWIFWLSPNTQNVQINQTPPEANNANTSRGFFIWISSWDVYFYSNGDPAVVFVVVFWWWISGWSVRPNTHTNVMVLWAHTWTVDEMVSDLFYQKKTLTSPPPLTVRCAIWLGQIALPIQLPLFNVFGLQFHMS